MTNGAPLGLAGQDPINVHRSPGLVLPTVPVIVAVNPPLNMISKLVGLSFIAAD